MAARSKGRKNPVHRELNLAMYLLGCTVVGTGLMLWLRLPHGPHGRRWGGDGGGPGSVLGMTRQGWGDVHLYAALALVALATVHLWMNRVWLVKIAGGAKPWRLWVGLALGVAIVAGLVAMPVG